MKTKEIKIAVEVLEFEELTPLEQTLVTRAREMTSKSYAPYSRFCVGAAIALSNGEIVTGANQENVAYPSGTCAERTVYF